MHPAGQQQQRRGNSTRMPLMYSSSLPPGPLLPGPPIPLRYGGNSTYQQPLGGIGGGGGGGMKHHQRGGGNRGGRGGSIIPHRQQRPTAGSRYHPYAFRQPLPPQQQRSYRPTQFAPRTPAAYMGTSLARRTTHETFVLQEPLRACHNPSTNRFTQRKCNAIRRSSCVTATF